MKETIKRIFARLFLSVLISFVLQLWLIVIGTIMIDHSDQNSVINRIGVVILWVAVGLAVILTIYFMWGFMNEGKMTPSSFFNESSKKNKEPMDEDSYLNYAYMKMCEKCGYSDEIDKLTEEERVIYVTQYLAAEVHNGGFEQFYSNSSGDFANDVIKALKTLGAERVLSICQKANAIFGESVPTDRDERNIFLTEKITTEQEEILEKCDEEFYEAYGVLSELSYRYLKEYEEKMSEATDQMPD